MDNGWGRGRLGALDREILRLTVPSLGALVAEPLLLLGDAAVVARLGTAPLAAVAIAGTVLATVVGLCVFLAYGTTASVARRVGAGDAAGAARDGVAGLWLAAGLGGVLAVAVLATARPLVELLGAGADTVDLATTYLQVSALGLPAMLLVLAGTGIRRGLQDTRTPLVVAVAAASANLALCAWFVLGLDWGVAGSAWATVIAQVGAAATYLELVRRDLRRSEEPVRPDRFAVIRAAAAGFALAVRTLALRAVLLLALGVAARLGTAEVAAYQIAFLTWTLLALALDALAIAGQAIVGRTLGAGDLVATRRALRRLVAWGVWTGVVLGALLLLLRPAVTPVFGLEPQVAAAVSVALVVVALHQPVAGPVFVLDGVLIGAGDNRWLAGAQVVVLIAFAPLAWLIPAVWSGVAGLVALWVALGWFLLVRLALLGYRARGDAWLVTGAAR